MRKYYLLLGLLCAPLGACSSDEPVAVDARDATADQSSDVASDLAAEHSIDVGSDATHDVAVDATATDAAVCDFSASYSYGPVGGNGPTTTQSSLSPGNRYRHERVSNLDPDAGVASCEPALPPCGSLDVITAYDIETHDLVNADVQQALAQATPPLYGIDRRPVDGQVFSFLRADGHGFLVGGDCLGQAACVPIPAGVAALKSRLMALDQQQTRDPSCAGVDPQ